MTRLAPWILIVSLVGALLPAAVRAQLEPERPTGSNIMRDPQAVAAERSGYILKGLGRCIYQRRVTAVGRLLAASDPMTIDYNRIGINSSKVSEFLSLEPCLTDQVAGNQSALDMRIKPRQLRNLLLEEDYLAKHATAPMVAATEQRHYVSNGDKLPTARAIGDFADCIAVKNPQLADRLLRTMPASSDETQVARTLAPDLGACIVQGQKLVLTPTSVRAYVADGMWTKYARAIDGNNMGARK